MTIFKAAQAQEEFLERAAVKPRNPAPIEVFPEKIQDIICDWHRCFQLPVDFYAASVLAVASAAIGNSYRIRIKEGHTEPAILWPVLVGPSSLGKTPAIRTAMDPLKEIEREYRRQYVLAQQEAQNDPDNHTEVKRRKVILNNATLEAISQVLSANPKGVLLFQDEILGWIEGMDAYRKGGDEQAWLSFFSGELMNVSRLSREELFIERPFISVIGGIQPGVLKSLAQGSKRKNGFLFRLLFAWPDDTSRPYPNDQELHPDTAAEYHRIITDLYQNTGAEASDSNGNVEPGEIRLSREAAQVFADWQRGIVDRQNDASEDENSMLGKIETYCKRLALVLELLHNAANGWNIFDTHEIKARSMNGAIVLAEYFLKNAQKVLDAMICEPDPDDILPQKQLDFYTRLPMADFTTGDAVTIGKEVGMPERNTKRLLNDGRLFKKMAWGVYRKTLSSGTSGTSGTNNDKVLKIR